MYSIYTFIEVQNPPQLPINLQPIEQFPQITKKVQSIFYSSNENLHDIYHNLNQCMYRFKLVLMKEEQDKGPKRFKKLINNLMQILLLQFNNYIERGSIEMVLLNLTYFEKYCHQYESNFTKARILLMLGLCNQKMNLLDIAMIKIKKAKSLLYQEKSKQLTLFAQILEGAVYMKLKNLKVAQIIFTKITNQCSSLLSQQVKVTNQLNKQVVKNMCISLYFLSELSKMSGKCERSAFQLTRSVDFAQTYLGSQAELYVEKIKSLAKKSDLKLKLARTQCKIQQISLIQRHKSLYRKHFSSKTKTDLSKKLQKIPNMQEQLKNIFIIKQNPPWYKLKSDTLKTLKKQETFLTKKIISRALTVKNLEKEAIKLKQQVNLQQIKQHIDDQINEEQRLKSELQYLKKQKLSKLPQTSKLCKYFLGFLQIIKRKESIQNSQINDSKEQL